MITVAKVNNPKGIESPQYSSIGKNLFKPFQKAYIELFSGLSKALTTAACPIGYNQRYQTMIISIAITTLHIA
ncbi:hypothetical protein IJU97_04540 [bacterium]|nr:hypothetical protein [bacterium]